jgi:hypothetical protein
LNVARSITAASPRFSMRPRGCQLGRGREVMTTLVASSHSFRFPYTFSLDTAGFAYGRFVYTPCHNFMTLVPYLLCTQDLSGVSFTQHISPEMFLCLHLVSPAMFLTMDLRYFHLMLFIFHYCSTSLINILVCALFFMCFPESSAFGPQTRQANKGIQPILCVIQ